MFRVLTAEQSRAMELRAVATVVGSLAELMDRAGEAVAIEVMQRAPEGDVAVLAGSGNNGGDGWVAARLLHESGRQVEVLSLKQPHALAGEASYAAAAAIDAGVRWRFADEAPDDTALSHATVVIDALLGTGATLPLREPLPAWCEAINTSGAIVVSVDLPTGVDSDTGQASTDAVQADVTVTFTAPKRGLVIHPGAACSREVVVADIGIPAEFAEVADAPELWEDEDYAALLPAPVKATPLARRVANAQGIDLAGVRGSGPDGMIVREDVERRMESGIARSPSPVGEAGRQPEQLAVSQPPSSIIPHTLLRRTIAERMSHSAFTAPHVTLMTEAEATNLVSARVQLNQELRPQGAQDIQVEKISYNALLAALAARALREHPGLNARWEADGVYLLSEINIALAVETERGLLTPVLRDVDRLSLPAIQRGYSALIDRALAGKSLPDDFAGGTFTITNLGGLEVDGFTPIINPPQAAILGIGRIIEKPVAREGSVVVRAMVTLSLSFDHRIVDGAPAAAFLQRVKQLVERPMALLLGSRDA